MTEKQTNPNEEIKVGDISSHFPPVTRSRFERKNLKLFSPQYPLDKRSRFERKKIKKALGKFPKAVDFFTFS